MSRTTTDKGRVINEIYAWVSIEPNGDENIVAHHVPAFGMMPLVGAEMQRMTSLRRLAEQWSKATGYPIQLVRFNNRMTLETFP